MAFLLFKYIRRKIRENRAQEGMPSTSDENHPMFDIPHTPTKPAHENNVLLHGSASPATSTRPVKSHPTEDAAENERFRQEKRKASIRRWKLMLGLILPNFLAAVDVTIVAPAIPTISSHFSESENLHISSPTDMSDRLSGSFNWIVAAYTLTFTTFVPASGQIADVYGRHFALHFQMFWILIGSVLCASSVSWGMLLFGRALQGLGAAGILNLTRIILSDGMTLAENSKNNTVFSLISGIRYALLLANFPTNTL